MMEILENCSICEEEWQVVGSAQIFESCYENGWLNRLTDYKMVGALYL